MCNPLSDTLNVLIRFGQQHCLHPPSDLKGKIWVSARHRRYRRCRDRSYIYRRSKTNLHRRGCQIRQRPDGNPRARIMKNVRRLNILSLLCERFTGKQRGKPIFRLALSLFKARINIGDVYKIRTCDLSRVKRVLYH